MPGTGTGTGTGAKKKIGRPKGSKSGYTMSEKALAQRRSVENPLVNSAKPFEGEDIGYNGRVIDHIMQIHEIATHADRNDINSLKACFINYLRLCQKNGMKVGNLAAYAAMGIDRATVYNWEKSDREEYKQFVKFVKMTCSLSREELIADQKINPVIGIFWQRNYDGLRNDTEQIQAIQEETQCDEKTVNDYRKKYGDLLEE